MCFEKPSFIEHSYAVGVGRGPHRASLRYLAWLRQYDFRLALDIRRYFPSVRHDVLYGLFARRLRDRDTLALLELLLRAGGAVYQTPEAHEVLGAVPTGRGLAIGSYLSQWSGAFYLDGLDHFVKRELKIGAYLRYMDDFTLFGDDPVRLEEARGAIAAWLERHGEIPLPPYVERAPAASDRERYQTVLASREGAVAPQALPLEPTCRNMLAAVPLKRPSATRFLLASTMMSVWRMRTGQASTQYPQNTHLVISI